MQRLLFGTIGSLLLLSLSVPPLLATQVDATPPASATPSAEPGLSFVLPTEEQVPNGLVVISDGERTLADVASGFSDPKAATEQFADWGWQGNVIRAFHLSQGATVDPDQIDGIYLSVHAFGSPESAAAALDYSFDVHAETPELEEVEVADFGDTSRALYGTMPYGNEMTLYVQQDTVLIRLSASSPEGDPTVEAIGLMQTILNSQPATPTAT